MKKAKIISGLLIGLSITMISLAITIQSNQSFHEAKKDKVISYNEIDIKNVAISSNVIVKQMGNKVLDNNQNTASTITEVDMETAPASIVIPPRVEVYEGMTIEELAEKLDRNLGNGYIAGKGFLIATHCLELGVDPYVAVAIMLHETGCKSSCSKLVVTCNNVGGQKGAPGCNGGAYKSYNTLDEGIIGFIDNLYRNYYSRGLNTIESIGPKYAESPTWVSKIYGYVEQIRAN